MGILALAPAEQKINNLRDLQDPPPSRSKLNAIKRVHCLLVCC